MKTFLIEITGIAPLLQHRATEEALRGEGNGTRGVRVAGERETPREAADKAVYRDSEDHFYFPGAAIARLVREAAANHKQRGNRKSMKYVVPGAVFVGEDGITLLNGAGPIEDFEVDSRPVTIPATKGRIMRHRARFEQWRAEFHLEIDDAMLDPAFVQQLLVEGGRGIGIGDYRPEKGGPFGRFQVTRWEALTD